MTVNDKHTTKISNSDVELYVKTQIPNTARNTKNKTVAAETKEQKYKKTDRLKTKQQTCFDRNATRLPSLVLSANTGSRTGEQNERGGGRGGDRKPS